MNEKEMNEIIKQHVAWLLGSDGGARANLRGEDLSGADLSKANLRGADLSKANLRGADLREADLSGANLRGADLSKANLRGADLSKANLRGADLSGEDLSGADLSKADLREADLSGANLRGANLSKADLREADLGSNHIFSVSGYGRSRRMTTYWVESDRVWCGCFSGTLDEFEAAIEKTHANNQEYLAGYRAVVALFRASATFGSNPADGSAEEGISNG